MLMKFINPQFLWALGVLAIPVIIHLFNFRRFKKVIFPNLRFLQEVQLQNRNKRELRKFLVLAARLLALTFLVFAFAGPYIPGNEGETKAAGNRLSIYIDNSFSMNAEGSEGILLEMAKEKARNLASAYNETDEFQLLSNDFEAKHQRVASREDFLKWVDELDFSPKTRPLSEVLERQKNFLLQSADNTTQLAFQISDFQKSSSDISSFKSDTSYRLYLLPVQAGQMNNISIDSAWFDSPYIRPGVPCKLNVKVHNYGNGDVEENTLTLTLNGTQKGLSSFKLEAGLETILELSFIPEKAGWNEAVISLQDYPVVFDDKLYLAFDVRESRKVLHISENPGDAKEIPAAYSIDSFFQFQSLSPGQLDYQSLGENDLIILDGVENASSGLVSELKKFVDEGGSLMLFPNEKHSEANKSVWQGLDLGVIGNPIEKKGEMDRINTDHPLFKEVIEKIDSRTAFPQYTKYFPITVAGSDFPETLIGDKEGNAFLNLYTAGEGNIYAFYVPLNTDWSNLSRHFLFPAVMLQAGFRSVAGDALYYEIGENVWVPLLRKAASDDVIELYNAKQTLIPELNNRNRTQYLKIGEEIKEAGLFQLRKKGESGAFQSLGLNYSRKESATANFDEEEIRNQLAPGVQAELVSGNAEETGKMIKEIDSGTQLWKLAVLLALLFVTIEILLLRFLKTA